MVTIIPPNTPPPTRPKMLLITAAPPKKSTFKTGQRYPTPPTTDSLYIFYTSLLKQNPQSHMALRWCLEHGLVPTKNIPSTMELLNPMCKKNLTKQFQGLQLKSE